MTTTKTTLNQHLINVLSDVVLDYTRGDEVSDARAATLDAIKQIKVFDDDLMEDGYNRADLPYATREIVEALEFYVSNDIKQSKFELIERGLLLHFNPDYDSSDDESDDDDSDSD